jgi:hypothetical protein
MNCKHWAVMSRGKIYNFLHVFTQKLKCSDIFLNFFQISCAEFEQHAGCEARQNP